MILGTSFAIAILIWVGLRITIVRAINKSEQIEADLLSCYLADPVFTQKPPVTCQ